MRNTCLLTAKAIETATNGNLRKTKGTFRNPGQVLGPTAPQTPNGIIPVGDVVLPVDEVGGSVHGVDDPGRLVRQDARLPVGDRLLSDEAAAKEREKFTTPPPLGKAAAGEMRPRERPSPVRPLAEFLLQGPDDDPLHSLVGLGDQIHGRALGLDLNLALPGFPDLLNESRWEQNVPGNPLPDLKTRALPTSPAIFATSTAYS